jgi:hypothetical protein
MDHWAVDNTEVFDAFRVEADEAYIVIQIVVLEYPSSNYAVKIKLHMNFVVVKNFCSKATSVVLNSNSLAQVLRYNQLSLDAMMEFKCYLNYIRDAHSEYF